MAVTFIGLDGEMTSSELADNGALIQLGLSTLVDGEMLSICVNINPYFDDRKVEWSDQAAAVHKIPIEIVKSFEPPQYADLMLADWLQGIGAKTNKRNNTVPVGFNVGAFDMPFVKNLLPQTYQYLSRRTVDLNALCFALAGEFNFDTWKTRAKEYATEKIGYENQHDAGWDATMHLYAFEYLRKAING